MKILVAREHSKHLFKIKIVSGIKNKLKLNSLSLKLDGIPILINHKHLEFGVAMVLIPKISILFLKN